MTCTSVANSIVDLIVLIYSRIHYVQPNKIVDGLLFLGRSPNGVMKIKRPSMPSCQVQLMPSCQVPSEEPGRNAEIGKRTELFFWCNQEWMNEWIPWGVKHHWARVIVFFGVGWVEKRKRFLLELFLVVRLMGQIKSYVTNNLQYTQYTMFFFRPKNGGWYFCSGSVSEKLGSVCWNSPQGWRHWLVWKPFKDSKNNSDKWRTSSHDRRLAGWPGEFLVMLGSG